MFIFSRSLDLDWKYYHVEIYSLFLTIPASSSENPPQNIKDLEKSLKSEWLSRIFEKNKSYYMNLKLI